MKSGAFTATEEKPILPFRSLLIVVYDIRIPEIRKKVSTALSVPITN